MFTALQQRSLSRLKTLQIHCKQLGYDITTQENYSAENMATVVRYMLLDRKHGVALNSVPKTGSTAWRYALYNNSHLPGPHEIPKLQHGQKINYIHGSQAFRRTSIRFAKNMNVEKVLKALNTYYTILTVRHPFDRVESSYVDKIVLQNMYGLREEFLQKRGLGKKAVQQLAKDGNNIKFEEFLQHVITEREYHWTSIFELTYPCSIPYRYLAFIKIFMEIFFFPGKQILQHKRNLEGFFS